MLTVSQPAVADLFAGGASGWIDSAGKRLPDTDLRKSVDGFAGYLLVTADADWYAKWNTPLETVPQIPEAEEVAVGGRLSTLIIIANPRPDDDGRVRVKCDLRVTRPDGSTSVDASDIDCLAGVTKAGEAQYLRLAQPVLEFVAEPDDLPGVWRTDVTVRDVNGGREMTLTARVTLRK